MDEQLIREFSTRARSMAHFETGNRFPPSTYYNFLRVLVQAINARVAVELGVCGGGGSYYMSMASRHCKVIGIDIAREYDDNISFMENTLPNFRFILDDSVEAASIIEREYKAIDLLFIDTDHTYEQTKIEFETYLPLMAGHGQALICMDDINREGAREYWNEIELPKVEIPVLHLGGSKTDGSFGIVWGL